VAIVRPVSAQKLPHGKLGVPACLTLQHFLVYFSYSMGYALDSSIPQA